MSKLTGSGKGLIAVLLVYCLSIALIFQGTLMSMVAIWTRSETFTHGFVILPISLWLAWRMRDRMADLPVRPEPWVLTLVLGAGLVWLLANLVDVLVVQQLAFIAVLITGIWAIAGNAVVRRYAFPLGFLFLGVPMGEELIPPLMEFTADTTEYLVRASGVPIYREGMYLYLPTGTWSVVEGCSGVRYVIASVTLGLVYAHLSYNSFWRKVAFVALASTLPILANSVRAYALVMGGHLSDMTYFVGADHLVFGWVFFGVVMVLMFWIGSFWTEPEQPLAPVSQPTTSLQNLPAFSLALVTGLAIASAGVWVALAAAANHTTEVSDMLALKAPEAAGVWQSVDGEPWPWTPAQPGADRELDQVYYTATEEPTLVGLHLRQYLQQRQDVELVNSQHPLRPDRQLWRLIDQQRTTVDLHQDQSLQVDEARVSSPRDNLLIWSWYHVDDRNTANPYLVKLLEARQQIFEGHRIGTRVFIATPLSDDRDHARKVLKSFIMDNLTAIEASLDDGISAPSSARVAE